MPPSEHDLPLGTGSLPASPVAASKIQRARQSLNDMPSALYRSETLPYRRSHPSAASLYASTLSPPASRSQSPVGRPASRLAASSVFGTGVNNALALVSGAGDNPGDPLNLILGAFVPHVAVYTSEDTDVLLKEKGFSRGLWELLRPFGERVQGKVIVRDSIGSSRTFEDYSIRFVQFGEGIVHPEPATTGLRTNGGPGKPGDSGRGPLRTGITISDVEAVVDRHLNFAEESFFSVPPPPMNRDLDIDVPSPYYSLYLRRLLSGLPVTPHETLAHPVACVIAISSRNPSPIEAIRRLYTESSEGDKRLPVWVDGEFLRYYVLIHEEERDDITRSMSLFEQMKRSFGLHCHLLRIRGTQSAATDDDSIPLPRSEWMSAAEELADLRRSEDQEDFEDPTRYIFESDATAIRTFIREMVTQSIIPTMERHVTVWNDQVASRRRGLAGRFAGLTKRWGFGGGPRSSISGQSSGSNYDTHGFYRPDAPEAIMRKLADYAFMLRDWKLAHSTYEILRNDYNGDKAWKYYAATNEMSAISLLILPQNLSSKSRTDTIDSAFEAAFYSYITRCSMPYGALRCIVLGMELLRIRGGSSVDDAAKWGLRLLESKILGAVGDALIRERLAVCYGSKKGLGTHGWGGRRRKSGMWSALSAEAWLSQGKHIQAQRCLNEARRTYAALPSSEHGIDGFAYASAFMLDIGKRLNRNLDSDAGADGDSDDNDDDDDDDNDDEGGGGTRRTDGGRSETIDEESEALDTPRGRRVSMLGAPSGGLETAPLRSQIDTKEWEGRQGAGDAQDDFG
ncbi:ER-golgi trafficking TRAPP I complex 85 kDa subunit-domain-containing protein [Durotheca rogersii]|uniref:ER-golgi trafficking TRAPP I complex 85 kDa subunit-domain-containing protein n=1 Tax=Durotheca rogersii TaxID=419775 RepID=UPI00221EE64C|nr:ER-golgi trafficking TRAPP I complex 85 kDa subunit-domain-containing protein [Durotheca rogersii]KAI5861582.1 ER-golgi trafficking TRAPP I complex 85 kDa subunit-domain-containing protein [Durotheca rogersii]